MFVPDGNKPLVKHKEDQLPVSTKEEPLAFDDEGGTGGIPRKTRDMPDW